MGLLALGRDENEQIMVGDDIVITVVKANNGKATIAIDAPRDVKILRRELWLKERATDHREIVRK